MPRYAVKIGEIHLVSNKPITEEERKRATGQLARSGYNSVTEDGLIIVSLPQP